MTHGYRDSLYLRCLLPSACGDRAGGVSSALGFDPAPAKKAAKPKTKASAKPKLAEESREETQVKETAMTTPKIPTKPGTAFGGGYYAGRFFIADHAYALIVSPKAAGTIDSTPWNESTASVAGDTSYNDGAANTAAMAKAGSTLAKKITGLRIGKFKDWYLPSRLELMLAYHELGAARAFKPGGKQAFDSAWYWSSTQHAEYSDYAWMQHFGNGDQDGYLKSDAYRARAVRRLIIQ